MTIVFFEKSIIKIRYLKKIVNLHDSFVNLHGLFRP